MKKISFLAMLAMLAFPAVAKEAEPVTEKANADVVAATEKVDTKVAQAESTVEALKSVDEVKKTSNRKTKFPHGLQLGVGVSPTSGLNGFIGYNNKNFDSFWWKRLGVRFDIATYSPIKHKLNKEINEMAGEGKDSLEIGDLAVENFAMDANHYGAMIDFYPFGNTWLFGGLRLSGGYVTGKLDFTTDITSRNLGGTYQIELNGHTYEYNLASARGKAKVNWKYSGPYIGTGFDLGIFRGFKLYFDAGVVMSDKPAKADLDVPLNGLNEIIAGVPTPVAGSVLTQFEDNKKAELRKVQDELDKYEYFPVIKFGFMYRF